MVEICKDKLPLIKEVRKYEEKGYEKPQIVEKMSIEEVLMDEDIAPEWINWQQSWHNWNNWNNSWNNKVATPGTGEPIKGGEEG